MKCSYGTVDETQCVNDTSFIYSYGNYYFEEVNMCVNGFETDGTCSKIIGQNCSAWDNTCDIVDNAYCNVQSVCSCKIGFTEDMGKCEPVIGMNCTDDVMCSSKLAWTRCMESYCSCIEGYVDVNRKCVSYAEREDICHQSIRRFPDKYRRSPLYRLSPTELPVRDDLIEEKWYDFGKHMLSAASSVTNTSPGTCGTKYPIYLKDGINSADVVGLQFGELIEKTVQIGGLSVYGISKEFNVSIRNCSGSYFIFIKKAPIPFSGYCVDTGISSNIGGNSSRKWAQVATNLDFRVVYDATTGTEMQIPYTYFQCHIFDSRINHYQFFCKNCYNEYFFRYYIDDGFFYTVNWYIDGTHCKSAGPYKRPNLNISDISEREIKDECGQHLSGFSVQCSFEWSESMFGHRSTPIFSNTHVVGFESWFLNSSFDGGFIDTMANTPIGCKTAVGDTLLTCDIEWELIKVGNCASPLSADDHPVCGFTAKGLTAEGLMKYGSWNNAYWSLYSNWTTENKNGTLMSANYRSALKILVTQFESHSSDDVYKVKFSPSVTGHDLWNGYMFPDIEIKIVDPSEQNITVHVGWNTGYQLTIMTKTVAISYSLNHSISMSLSDTGEFLMLRGNTLPVEVQIKMRQCKKKPTSSCLCAVTCRNGNEIYTIDICDSIKIEGFLMVHPNEDGLHSFAKDAEWWWMNQDAHISTHSVRLLNGIHVKVIVNFKINSLELTLTNTYTNEEFIAMDGLAAFQQKQYRLSNGSFVKDESGFQTSWSVPFEDSLTNPSQHVTYAYTERFYQCDCPSKDELTSLTQLISENYYGYSDYKQITGAVRCSQSIPCSEEHTGLTWPGSQLQPVVQVEYVFTSLEPSGITCEFKPIKNKQHIVRWYAGDKMIVMEQKSANAYGLYVLVLKDTFNQSGQDCLLNFEIYCSVTVYETGSSTSTNPAAYSDAVDIRDVPLWILSDICIIDGKCYNKNDTNGNDASFVCYPLVNPFEWTKDLSLIRQIGDGCIPSENHCSSINGSAFCNAKTSKCECVETHENVNGQCIQKDCSTDQSICDPILYAECLDGGCACVKTAELKLQYGVCKPKVLGSECTNSDQCGHIPSAKCDLNQTETCVCFNQYDNTYGACTIKRLASPCNADVDCAHMRHASCLVSTSGERVCSCSIGYKTFATPECVLKEAFLTFSYVTTLNGIEKRMSTCAYEFETGVSYTVSWIVDDVVVHTNSLKQTTDKSFNSISVDDLFQEYLDTNPVDRCSLDRAWKCSISTFYIDGQEALPTINSTDFKIVDLGDPNVYIPRGGETIFYFTVNLPLLCDDNEDCYLEFRLFDETDSYNCEDATVAVKSKQTCGNRFQGEKKGRSRRALQNSYHGSMRLTTKNNKKYKLRDSFTLTMKIEAFGEVDSFWKKCKLRTNIQVMVRDQDHFWKNTLCYATNDPRLKTFDGQYYSMQQEGEFIMYKHKQYPVEVQIETELCNGGWASCTCGVSVRAGKDLFVVNHCHDDHLVAAVNTTDGVLDGVQRSSYSQEFYLPYGTSIEVYYFVSTWWSPMNVYIYPSPADMNNVEGLCGHFNGNWSDDFVHRNGAKTLSHSSYWRWWWWGGDPVDFSKSWKVSDDESLLNPDRIAKLSKWNEEEQYCVCPKKLDGEREPTCHRREADSCAKIEEKTGKRFGSLKTDRDRRSVNYLDQHDIIERLHNLMTQRIYKRSISRVKRQVEASDEDYDKAVAECQQYLNANCNGADAASASSIAGNTSNDCAQDRMVDENADSSAATESACVSTKSVAKQIVERDIEFQAANPDVSLMFEQTCVDNCHRNGVCKGNDTCECYEGFDPLSNCKVNVSEPPEIISTTGGGVCNPKVKACEALRYTTKHGCSVESVCKVTAKEFYQSGNKVTHETTYVAAICDNGWDAYCPIPFNSRRKRSADPLLVVEYETAISNNNISFSISTPVAVLDSTCLLFHSSTEVITIDPQYCLIAGTCVLSGERDPGNACSYCSPDKDTYAWQTDGCEQPTSNKTPVIIGVAVAVPLAVILFAIMAIILYKKHKSNKIRTESSLYENAMGSHFKYPTLRVETPCYEMPSSPIETPSE
ncbi:uncharacterized protein LOC127872419 [Dreissena polymorpha]|uniref:uncharacterized protein LOC127872419 n=1 Tax=Dreissena polymorpha TaxID=45954 RepID=UPI002265398A|nr:uncharacterized protein LOC127872419 [Dreissena polymorpha]